MQIEHCTILGNEHSSQGYKRQNIHLARKQKKKLIDVFIADHILNSKVIQAEKITNRESHQVIS